MDDVQAKIKEALQNQFVGTVITKDTKDRVQLAMRETLARTEAVMYGYDDIKTSILWESFTFIQKCKWFYYNKLTSKGALVRAQVDLKNANNRMEAMVLKTDDEEELDYEYVRYPWYAELEPKQMIKVDAKIRLPTA